MIIKCVTKSPKLFLTCLSFWLIFSSCRTLERLEPEYWYEHTKVSKEGEYKIDPDTILDSISKQKKEIFTPISSALEGDGEGAITPVQWKQEDYFQIFESLYEIAWNDSWKDWEVENLFYRLECRDVEFGPQMFSIRLYQIVQFREEPSRMVRYIHINPLKNYASWTELEKYPVRETWKSIDMTQNKITSDVALKIAEENGGIKARLNIDNQCTIYITQFGWSINDGWKISYSAYNNHTSVFKLNIDPLTGDIQ